LCCAASWKLDRRARGGLIPGLAIVSLAWMLTSATLGEFAAVAGVLVVATLYYLLRRARTPAASSL
jgi:hypothetical protein